LESFCDKILEENLLYGPFLVAIEIAFLKKKSVKIKQLKEKLEKNALFSYLRENTSNNNDERPIESSSASSSTNNNENTPAPSSTASNSSTSNSQNNDYHRNDEQIALSLEPLDGLKVNLYSKI
jgi:hypothetical protein